MKQVHNFTVVTTDGEQHSQISTSRRCAIVEFLYDHRCYREQDIYDVIDDRDDGARH